MYACDIVTVGGFSRKGVENYGTSACDIVTVGRHIREDEWRLSNSDY